MSREYLDAVAKAGGDVQANYSSMEGYLAAKVFTEGLQPRRPKPDARRLITRWSRSSTPTSAASSSISARDHVASSFVELSMLTGDGDVRR